MQRAARFIISIVVASAFAGNFAPASAQQRARVMLAGARVIDGQACSVLTVRFASKIRYVSHGPAGHGDELHIKLAHIDDHREAVVDQESLHAPASEQAAVHAIELAYDAAGAELSVYFKRDVQFQVSANADGKSIVVAIAAAGQKQTCDATSLAHSDAQGPAPAEQERADEIMNALRKAVERGDIEPANALRAQASKAPDPRYVQELEEITAILLEKEGRVAEAASAYRLYLAHYPDGAGASRIRARLAIIDGNSGVQRNAQESGFTEPPPAAPQQPILDGAIAGAPPLSAERLQQEGGTSVAANPDGWSITQSGSTSLTYYRNEGGRDVFVPPRLQLGWDRESVYKLYQNSFVGTLDYDARFQKGTSAGSVRVSTARDQDLMSRAGTENSIYTASLSLEDKSSGVSGTVGRQTLYTSGVLGRFDGILASLQATENLRLNAVAGAPVWRGRDAPFEERMYFYGAGIGLEKLTALNVPVEPGLYYFHQENEGLVDREAVGATLAVRSETASMWTLADYDIHYGALNNAAFSASYMFENRALASINADYRRAPMIFTANALQGQPVATLEALLKIYSQPEIEQFALDRSAHSFTLDVNYALPIGDDWQIMADAYVSRMSGTIESGNVPAMLASGTDFYGFLQVSRYNLFTQGDSQSVGLRYGDTEYDHLYALEASARFPVAQDWSAGPTVRAGVSNAKALAVKEVQVMPSLHVAYRINEQATLDMEVGRKWIERETTHGTEHETELMALAGVRYDFYTK